MNADKQAQGGGEVVAYSAREYNEANGIVLNPGHFYWMQPTFDCDAPDAKWGVFPNSIQPARFIGYTDSGDERWDWLDGGREDWPPCWHGPEIETACAAPPSAPVGVEGLREIYSAVIRALAAIVTTGGSDKIEELGAIPRSPVMDQVAAIRGQMDKLSALAQQPAPSSPVGVEGYLVERLYGDGYGPARRIVDAAIYDPTNNAFWTGPEAQARHRVTPLVPARAQQPQGDKA